MRRRRRVGACFPLSAEGVRGPDLGKRDILAPAGSVQLRHIRRHRCQLALPASYRPAFHLFGIGRRSSQKRGVFLRRPIVAHARDQHLGCGDVHDTRFRVLVSRNRENRKNNGG